MSCRQASNKLLEGITLFLEVMDAKVGVRNSFFISPPLLLCRRSFHRRQSSLLRDPVQIARYATFVPIAIPDYDGWLVGGEIRNASWSERPLIVFSVHGPVGERGYIRTMQHILDHVALLRDRADLVLGGDFNVAVGYRQPRERIRVLRGDATYSTA